MTNFKSNVNFTIISPIYPSITIYLQVKCWSWPLNNQCYLKVATDKHTKSPSGALHYWCHLNYHNILHSKLTANTWILWNLLLSNSLSKYIRWWSSLTSPDELTLGLGRVGEKVSLLTIQRRIWNNLIDDIIRSDHLMQAIIKGQEVWKDEKWRSLMKCMEQVMRDVKGYYLRVKRLAGMGSEWRATLNQS